MSDELLELLWVIEATLELEPRLERVLDQIVAGPCFTAAELPHPSPDQRKAPKPKRATGGLVKAMGVEDDENNDNAVGSQIGK